MKESIRIFLINFFLKFTKLLFLAVLFNTISYSQVIEKTTDSTYVIKRNQQLLKQDLLNSDGFTLLPSQGYNYDNEFLFKLFFASDDRIIFEWNQSVNSSYRLKIGRKSGDYSQKSVTVNGSEIATRVGSTGLNLTTGKYYAVITNAVSGKLSDITQEIASNPNIKVTNEIEFIVESATAPVAVKPKGQITNPTPLFEWTPVPGVPAYWLILSTTPFSVETLPNGDAIVKGADIIWSFITNETSVSYGDLDSPSPFTVQAPPLIPNNEYNYTILNLFDLSDLSYVSSVFGGVVSIELDIEATLDPPVLVSPANNSEFFTDEFITFQWDAVEKANSYNFYIFEKITSFAGNEQELEIPIFNSTTSNTSIEVEARSILENGNYIWRVLPFDNRGEGNASVKRSFKYNIPTGEFVASAFIDGTNNRVLNYQINANSIQDGVTPNNPFLVNDTRTYRDTLVAGTYEFLVSRDGYFDTTFIYTIPADASTDINFYLSQFPARIFGSVNDQNGDPVSGSLVTAVNTSNGNEITDYTNSSGEFTLQLSRGTFAVSASKDGFVTSGERIFSLTNEQLNLSTPFVITEDFAFVAGKVLNDRNLPVSLATVSAIKDGSKLDVITDNSGNYGFTLSSGDWIINAKKSGFTSPEPLELNLATGENNSNQNLQLLPNANQVTGTVSRTVNTGTGIGGTAKFENVTVTATPSIGTPVTAVSGSSGQFNLNLKSGSYTISVSKSGYTADKSVQLDLGVGQTINNINFTLTENPSKISGIVKEISGNPIAGAVVKTKSGETAATLSNGTYVLSTSSGTKTLSVSKTGYVTPDNLTVSVLPGQSLSGINFSLIPNAAVISGKVRNFQTGLAEAVITAANGNRTLQVTTASNGSYELNIAPGRWIIKAAKQGFTSGDSIVVNIGAGQSSINNDFNLVETKGVISGSVTTGAGSVSNADLVFESIDKSVKINSKTNNLGVFSTTVISGKKYKVTVTKSGYTQFSTTTTELAINQNINISAVIKPNPSTISGEVSDNLNNPLSVNVYIINSVNGDTSAVITSGEDGKYSVGIEPGSYIVKSVEPGFTEDSKTLSVELGQSLNNVDFTLTENYAFMTGTVTDKSNNKLKNVKVDLLNETGGSTVLTGLTGNSGAYIFSELIGGVYNLKFSANGYMDTLITEFRIDDGESIELNMMLAQLVGEISGTIKDINGNPLNEVSVITRNTVSLNDYSTVTSEDGSYIFNGLPLGIYEVIGFKNGYFSDTTVTAVLSTGNTSQTADLEDFIINTAVIKGKITDASGFPLSFTDVSVSGENGSGNAKTDSEGNYSITNLLPGTFFVFAELEDYTPASSNVTLADTLEVNFSLTRNTGTISGTVKNQINQTLPFRIKLTAATADGFAVSITSSADGSFEFSDLETGKDYKVFTDIFRQGYINDSLDVTLPSGAGSSGTAQLNVTENISVIRGNSDIGQANVIITNQSGAAVSALSSSEGFYIKDFLPDGTYTIKPEKQGFVFSPATVNIALDVNDTVEVNFTASENTGNLTVNVKNNGGVNLSEVSVSVINSDTSVVVNKITAANGNAVFTSLPAGNYSVRPNKTGYTFSPASASANIAAGSNGTLSFTAAANNSVLSGKIVLKEGTSTRNGSNEKVKLSYQGSGQSFTVSANNLGNFKFNSVPSGTVKVFGLKSGFVSDTIDAVIGIGETVNAGTVLMVSSTVNITGKVVMAGGPASGVSVTASSSNSFNEISGSNGIFRFNNLPVSPGAGDTTIYSISINDADYPALRQVIKISGSQLNSTISVDDFILPSGKIKLTVNDGIQPLQGAIINLTNPAGITTEDFTNTLGVFETGSGLTSGEYSISVSKDTYLSPDLESTSITLGSDTSVVEGEINLPYSFSPLDEIKSDENKLVKVNYTINPDNAKAYLYYKKASEGSYTKVLMNTTPDNFEGVIPPTYSLEDINYYIEVENTQKGITYSSGELTISPIASGVLSRISVQPQLDNLTLRNNDEYTLTLTLRDGINEVINNEFIGSSPAGSISWSVNNTDVILITFPDENDKTTATLTSLTTGDSRIRITSNLRGEVVTKTFNVTVTESEITALNLSSPQTRLNNRSSGMQLTYTGSDTLSQIIYLGKNVTWTVLPAGAGTVSQTGLFVPTDSTIIGEVFVTVKDNQSGNSVSTSFSLFAELTPDDAFTLTDGDRVEVSFSKNSVAFPVEVTLGSIQFGPAKRNFVPVSGGATYVVSSKIINLEYRADVKLEDDELLVPAQLTMDADESLKLFDGETKLGYYDRTAKTWQIIGGSSKNLGKNSTARVSSNINKFGEYSLLIQNEPLGIKEVSILPTPFSPKVSPVKIGYFLSTGAPPANVTIRIYNIRGELVRTLIENDIQYPGRYGSSSGEKEITWDGTTDTGNLARNGRYIIQITAKDAEKEVTELTQVVLIK